VRAYPSASGNAARTGRTPLRPQTSEYPLYASSSSWQIAGFGPDSADEHAVAVSTATSTVCGSATGEHRAGQRGQLPCCVWVEAAPVDTDSSTLDERTQSFARWRFDDVDNGLRRGRYGFAVPSHVPHERQCVRVVFAGDAGWIRVSCDRHQTRSGLPVSCPKKFGNVCPCPWSRPSGGARAAFTAASVWCGMSTSATELVVARIFQGSAGAGMAAQTIAILIASFPPSRHQQVFALYGATAGFPGMLGPIVGGPLLTADIGGLGWHSVFLMNLPIGVLAFVLGFRYLHLSRPPERDRLDLGGVALSTVSLFTLLAALADIQQNGWRPGPFGVLGAAFVLGAVFFGYERSLVRRGGSEVRWCAWTCSPIGLRPRRGAGGEFLRPVHRIRLHRIDHIAGRTALLPAAHRRGDVAVRARRGCGFARVAAAGRALGVKVLALGIAVYGGLRCDGRDVPRADVR
jgi:MFS family permease